MFEYFQKPVFHRELQRAHQALTVLPAAACHLLAVAAAACVRRSKCPGGLKTCIRPVTYAVHLRHEQTKFRRGAVTASPPPPTPSRSLQLKRETNGSGNTVTLRPGGLSWRLSEPIESHKCVRGALVVTSISRNRCGLTCLTDFQPRPNRWTT